MKVTCSRTCVSCEPCFAGFGTRPLRERIRFAAGPGSIETDRIGGGLIERMNIVGHHQRMGFAILALPPETEQPLLLQQPMDEIPVGFALTTIRSRWQRLRQAELEITLGLRMLIEHVGDDEIDRLVLPIPHVATKAQEVHPRRETHLIEREAAIRPEPARRMDVAIDRQIGFVGLLDPQRHRLGNHRLEFDVTRRRNQIERHAVVAAELRFDQGPARHHRVIRQGGNIHLDQPVLLNQATLNGLNQFGHIHSFPNFL